MDFFTKLREFIAKCKRDRSILGDPELDFFREFIVALGGELDVPEEEDRAVANDWLKEFKHSFIKCPSTMKDLIEIKFLQNGTESKYGTYFEEKGLLGKGGFGKVFECKGILDEQSYAVKKIRIDCKKKGFDQLLREVTALAALSHQNIVRYFHAWVEPQKYLSDYDREDCESDDTEYGDNGSDDNEFEDNGSDDRATKEKETEDNEFGGAKKTEAPLLYILMEHCSKTLSKFLVDELSKEDSKREKARVLFEQILKAVEFIHANGFVHGDLNTENIFLDKNDTVRVGDFGLSRVVDEEGHVLKSNSYGIDYYMSPESKKGEVIDEKADMYSLGVILGELLHPVTTGSERLQTLRKLKEEFPDEWGNDNDEDAIRNLLSVVPQGRRSASEFLQQFNNYIPDRWVPGKVLVQLIDR